MWVVYVTVLILVLALQAYLEFDVLNQGHEKKSRLVGNNSVLGSTVFVCYCIWLYYTAQRACS